MQGGEWQAAIRLLKKALTIFLDNERIYDSLIASYMQISNNEQLEYWKKKKEKAWG